MEKKGSEKQLVLKKRLNFHVSEEDHKIIKMVSTKLGYSMKHMVMLCVKEQIKDIENKLLEEKWL